ncbi:Aste57867_3263 [Aphanomyces stellatus]|uniref:Aste57867_3263 protein n=1 Tax=Aphanomyces stellatus TaxID=120398 RepID=A0A485K9A8_9STRA|nr:hypothetical protein As57867_003253 [Aphanomyces stellatus]VFT80435.1 Aste57867_3263 [Aphanomyces stellatus]
MQSWPSATAGVLAGCITRTVTSPMDVVKINVQVHGRGCIRDTCHNIYKTQGVRGFWKGNLAGCCRLGPYSGIKFCLYEQLDTHLRDAGGSPSSSSTQHALTGAVAGAIATIFVYPMELVRTRLIVSNQTKIGREFRRIWRIAGVRGLYRGCLTGLVGAMPFEGIQFACYEHGKTVAVLHRLPVWRWPPAKTSLDSWDHLALGSLSGAVAQLVVYPLDTVKKRLQLQEVSPQFQVRYLGILDCMAKIVRDEGIRGLYRGSLPNLVRLVPYSAVMFASYESLKELLD